MLRYALIAIVCEKIVQHAAVTIAFWRNADDIRSTVAVDPDVLIVLGTVVAVLFVLALWGMVRRRGWTPNLLMGLAMFDLLGEFAAQGRLAIAITVSFIVAMLLLVLAFVYRRSGQLTT